MLWRFTGLPLYRDPIPEESAVGLFLYLVAHNGYDSPEFVAKLVGVRRANLMIGMEPDTSRFAEAIDCDPEKLVADSVRLKIFRKEGSRTRKTLSIRGIQISNRIHSIYDRRICPQCLNESWQHRFWWEITAIGTCPRHGCELVTHCDCGRKLSWRDAGLYRCTECYASDPERLPVRPAPAGHTAKDAYLLSRFGAAQSDPIPLLDQLPVYEAVATMERVGAAAQGFRQDWQNAKKLGVEERNLQQVGFGILREQRLGEVLDRLWNEYRARGDRTHDGFTTAYGWFYHWFNCKGGRKYSPLLADIFLTHGAEHFSLNANVRLGKLADKQKRMLSLKEAADRCDNSMFAMRSIFELIGVLRREKRSGAQHSFPVEVVERIAKDLRRSCTLREARQKLGVGDSVIHELIEQRTLVPKLKRGSRHRQAYVFSIDDVDELLKRMGRGAKVTKVPSKGLVSLDRRGLFEGGTAYLIRSVLEGRLRIRERNTSLAGARGLFVAREDIASAIADIMPNADVPAALAARQLRVNQPGLRKAVVHGLLQGATKGGRLHIPRAAIARFSAKYIILVEVCERAKQSRKRVLPFLARHGAPPDPLIAKCRLVGFDRPKVEGLLQKVKAGELSIAPGESEKAKFVRAVVQLLAKAKSPISTAKLVSELRRRKVRLGPSDSLQFLYGSMWESRDTIVNIPSAGWWLKVRAFVPAAYSGDGSASDQFDRVADAIVKLLSEADHPILSEGILAQLDASGIAIAAADREVFLRQLVARNRDRIAKLTGIGYWLRQRPYPPAKYEASRYPSGVQTRWQRIGAFVAEHLETRGKPCEHGELGLMLTTKGILAKTRNARDHVNDALSRLPNEFIYLWGHGYWLRQRPYGPAEYHPTGKAVA